MFVDECIFTSNTIHKRSFCLSKQRLKFPRMTNISPALHLVAGVSCENGLEGFMIFERSIDSLKFITAIKQFSIQGNSFSLLGDNASWHTSRLTFEKLGQMGIYYIKNVPYSPQLNPIENVFSLIKNAFKRNRLQALQNGD